MVPPSEVYSSCLIIAFNSRTHSESTVIEIGSSVKSSYFCGIKILDILIRELFVDEVMVSFFQHDPTSEPADKSSHNSCNIKCGLIFCCYLLNSLWWFY